MAVAHWAILRQDRQCRTGAGTRSTRRACAGAVRSRPAVTEPEAGCGPAAVAPAGEAAEQSRLARARETRAAAAARCSATVMTTIVRQRQRQVTGAGRTPWGGAGPTPLALLRWPCPAGPAPPRR